MNFTSIIAVVVWLVENRVVGDLASCAKGQTHALHTVAVNISRHPGAAPNTARFALRERIRGLGILSSSHIVIVASRVVFDGYNVNVLIWFRVI